MLVHHHPANKHAMAISEWMSYEFTCGEVTSLVGRKHHKGDFK